MIQSVRSGLEDLGLEHVWIVHLGKGIWPLDARATTVGLKNCGEAFRKQGLAE